MTSSSDENREILRLASADNFRDVAGPGYATRDGGRVRRGVFYRSNEQRLTDADHEALSGLGLRTVLDLRSQLEIDLHPDVEVPGAAWHNFDVSGIPMDHVAELRDHGDVLAAVRVGDVDGHGSGDEHAEGHHQDDREHGGSLSEGVRADSSTVAQPNPQTHIEAGSRARRGELGDAPYA